MPLGQAQTLRRLLNQAWDQKERGESFGALQSYREALVRAVDNPGLAAEIQLLIEEMEQRCPPAPRLSAPAVQHLSPAAHITADHLHRLTQKTLIVGLGHAACVACAPSGDSLAYGTSQGSVTIWSLLPGSAPLMLDGHIEGVLGVAFHPSGQLLATAAKDGTVRLWRLPDGAPVAVLRGHTHWVTSVAFSPDGALLATGSRDGTMRLWESDGTAVWVQEGQGDIYSVAFTPDGGALATGGAAGVRLWRTARGAVLRDLRGYTPQVLCLAVHPHGGLVAAGAGDGVVRLWRVEDGMAIASLRGHSALVSALAFSPDGALLVSGSGDATLRFWDVQELTELYVLRGHSTQVEGLAFAPDGSALASAGYEGVRVWSPR